MKNLLPILLLILSHNSFATRAYCFSESGNNTTGAGTRANPYRDQTKSISLSTGDSLLFECGGSYTGKISKSTGSLYIGSYGSGAKPIIIYSGADAERSRYTIYLSGSNCKIMGLNITYPSQGARGLVAYVSIGINLDGGDNNFVSLCDFSKIGLGVYMASNTGNTISYCTFRDMRMIRNDNDAGDNDYGANGINFDASSSNTIQNCTFDSCFDASGDYTTDGGAVESYNPCSNNTIKYCTILNTNGVMEVGSGSGGTSANNLVAFCKIINCGELTYTSASGGFPVQCVNLQYFNNTIVDTASYWTSLGSGTLFNWAGSESSDTVFNVRNNIFYLKGGIDITSTGDAAKLVHRGNIYILSSGSITNYTIGGTEKTSTTVSEFASMSTFALNGGAQARGLGDDLGITPDFAGTVVTSTPDAGYLQYVTPSGPASTNIIRFPAKINGKSYSNFKN